MPLGVELESDSYSKLWIYDRSGRLLDRSLTSSVYTPGKYPFGFAPFYSRPEDEIRFKPGDIIEYLNGDHEVKIGIVLYVPPSSTDIWKRVIDYQKAKVTDRLLIFADYSDDIYLVIDEDYQCWCYDINVPPTSILPLSIPLTPDTRDKLTAKYQWAAQIPDFNKGLGKECIWIYHDSCSDLWRANDPGRFLVNHRCEFGLPFDADFIFVE